MQKFYKRRQMFKINIGEELTERERQSKILTLLPMQYLDIERPINPYLSGWRDRYYNISLGGNIDDEFRKNMVHYYLKSLVWNFRYYYLDKCPSWSFYYPYSYPPLIGDIYNIIKDIEDINIIYKFEIGEPIEPQKLLVKILPLSSIIKYAAKNIKFDDDIINKYFPYKYGLNMVFHKYYHECTPRIPHFTRNIIDNIMNSTILTDDEKARNVLLSHGFIKNAELIINNLDKFL